MIFIDACNCKPTPRPPVWMMRQAGRYLPEYREIRKKHGFLEMCGSPELVKEITLQPIRRFDMDAAIIFSDILLPLVPMGLDLEYREGEGPVIGRPIREPADVARLKEPDLHRELGFLKEGLALTRAELASEKALIGFAGAPFTLACYAVQGRGGGQFEILRKWMMTHEDAFDKLLGRFADMTVEYLTMQARAGAQALQIFDTWGGLLSGYDYLHRVFPHVQHVLKGIESLGLPRILFIKGAGHFRDFLKIAHAEVIGLDWTMPLRESRDILGPKYAVQGNLDPMFLFADPAKIQERVLAIVELNQGQPGYIANLGHGIHKETPVEHARVFIDTIKSLQHSEA